MLNKSVYEPRAVSRDILSGSVGSICCCAVGQPFDTVKVRIQTNPSRFPNVSSTCYKIFTFEGIGAFWKGALSTTWAMMVENAAAFGVNEALKRAFRTNEWMDKHPSNSQRPDLTRPFAIGLLTGLLIAPFPMPFEIIKAKTQVVVERCVTSQEVIQRMVQRQGYTSFACGLEAQFARDGAFFAAFFGGYELFKYMLKTNMPNMPDELHCFLSGGLAGCLGWCFAMPWDVSQQKGAPPLIIYTHLKQKNLTFFMLIFDIGTQNSRSKSLRHKSCWQLLSRNDLYCSSKRFTKLVQWPKTHITSSFSCQCSSVSWC